MAINQPVALFQGQDFAINVTVTGVDITGWALRATVRVSRDESSPALITKTVGSGITITAGTLGKFTVTLTAADTAALTVDSVCYWSVSRTDSGSSAPLSYGRLVVSGCTSLPS